MSASASSGRIEVITFDAAGTLLRPHPSVGAVYREVASRHGRELSADALDERFRDAFHAVSKDERVADPEDRERDFWRRVVLNSTGGPGVEPFEDFEAFFAELWETFAHASRWRVVQETETVLKTLKDLGCRLGIISNWDRRLHTVLEETGLQPWFEVVVISTEARCEKPDPAIFRKAEKAFGVDAGVCLHIGDSPRHDIEGARAAGWQALLIRHDDQPAKVGEVGNLRQIAELLAK